jgi:hypothetical protein
MNAPSISSNCAVSRKIFATSRFSMLAIIGRFLAAGFYPASWNVVV